MRSMLTRSLVCSVLLLPTLALAQDVETQAVAEVTTEVAVDAGDASEPSPPESIPSPDAANAAVEAAAAPAPATATAASSSGLIGTAPEGKGQIVFFRPSKFTGAAIGFKVREGKTELGKLRNGKYFIANVEPGTHEYTVHSEAKDVLTMEVEAGETYYVQGTITMGFMAGRPNLSPADQATFDGMSGKLDLAE